MRAILFDLDGTLLDIDINAFLTKYFSALTEAVGSIVEDPASVSGAMDGIMHATDQMMKPHPGVTNQRVFVDALRAATGIDIEQHWEVFDRFYEETFPGLGAELGPAPGAHDAWSAALRCGLKVAVATNPIFPAVAIEHRLRWAGIDRGTASIVTTYEVMTASKPHAEYYRQTAEMLGVDPSDCLMVGDDGYLDMPAADIGMETFYVGPDPDVVADYRGSLSDLSLLIPRLCEAEDSTRPSF